MITDTLKNIDKYSKFIPQEALDYIKTLNPNSERGRHVLSDRVYVIVETSRTRLAGEMVYETHDVYADIQIILSGKEKIYYKDSSKLNVSIPYNEDRDITFYSDRVKSDYVYLDGQNFVYFLHKEAHAPLGAVNDESYEVLKAIIKIKY